MAKLNESEAPIAQISEHTQTGDTARVDLPIRAVTDAEIEHFNEYGWTILRGFFDKELVGDLLERAKAIADLDTLTGTGNAVTAAPSSKDPLFDRVSRSPRLGEAASRLLGEPVAMRRLIDELFVKPAKHGRKPTPPHQDSWNPFRNNTVTLWLALVEVTPDMGSMYFLNGSHKLGTLGGWNFESPEAALARFPRLAQCERNEPQYYAPGDAVVMHNFTIHGAPPNTTDRTRWVFRAKYFPADASFTGEPNETYKTDGLGLKAGQPLAHPKFPVVWTPESV